jgi:hypothetical protein
MSNPGRFSSRIAGTERFGYQSDDQKMIAYLNMTSRA